MQTYGTPQAASTRRLYVQMFKNFHAFLAARKAAATEAAFGVRLAFPDLCGWGLVGVALAGLSGP
jgi:hypothetical protein